MIGGRENTQSSFHISKSIENSIFPAFVKEKSLFVAVENFSKQVYLKMNP
jgi:hypothetical protein